MTCNETMLRITKASIVPKILKDNKEGTPRSARNAIELIQTFTDSALKQELLLFAKRVSNQPSSKYCKLLQNMVNVIDENILKRIIVNLGINSFSIGSNKLRESDKTTSADLRWFEILELPILKNASVSTEKSRLLSHYNEAGCYAFLLEQLDTDEQLRYAVALAAANLQSTFFIKPNRVILGHEAMMQMRDACNTIVVIANNNSVLQKQEADLFGLLREYRLLFGVCTKVQLEPQVLQEIADCGSLFCVSAADTRKSFARRNEGSCAMLLLDYEQDIRYVNDLILRKRDFHGRFLSKQHAETNCH